MGRGRRPGRALAPSPAHRGRPPRTLLSRVALVDTPGVGDLDAATAEVVLDAAEQAAGLIFVVDAAAPLRRPQLDLLARVGPTRPVVFVLTKIDQQADWRDVLEVDRALI